MCANSDVVDDTPNTTRKHRASDENEPRAALGAVDVNAPSTKSEREARRRMSNRQLELS